MQGAAHRMHQGGEFLGALDEHVNRCGVATPCRFLRESTQRRKFAACECWRSGDGAAYLEVRAHFKVVAHEPVQLTLAYSAIAHLREQSQQLARDPER